MQSSTVPERKRSGSIKGSDLFWLSLILILAAGLRFYHLDVRPFHHDEALHAFFSFNISPGLRGYKFDPVYHGPFLYWLEANLFHFFGAGDFSARIPPAVFATLLPLLCFFLRDELGHWGWITAALFITLSPSFTFYGRFLAHDNYVAVFTLGMVILGLRYGRSDNPLFLYLLALIMGLFISTKACFYIHTGIFVLFGMCVFALGTFAPRYGRKQLISETRQRLARQKLHFLLAFLLFWLVYALLYSSFFSHPQGIVDGIVKMLRYWGNQQAHPRLPGPPYYYLPRLLLHEPLTYLALPALIMIGRKPVKPFTLFLAFWSFIALLIYSFAQEKVPWLLVHPLLPMALLTGTLAQRLAGKRKYRPGLVLLLLFLGAWSLRETTWLCFQSPPEAPHLLRYMETSTDTKETAQCILALDDRRGQVFITGDATWVMAWYLRDKGVTYSLPKGWQKTAVAVVTNKTFHPELSGFHREYKRLRSWWLPDYRHLMSRELPDYLFRHRTTEPVGITHFYSYIRDPNPRESPGNTHKAR